MDEIKIVYKALGEITPYEKNPRKNDDAVPFVKNSIEQFGFKVPLIIDEGGVYRGRAHTVQGGTGTWNGKGSLHHGI